MKATKTVKPAKTSKSPRRKAQLKGVDSAARSRREAKASADAREPMSGKDYEKALKKLHVELVKLQQWVVGKGLKVCIVFEGRDGAGKGGTIKAITERVSPRVFRVVALPAPSDREKSQMYMQRYLPHFPAAGEIVIFDRSWYNRAGVERVMGFCTQRAVRGLPEAAARMSRRAIVDSGVIQLMKYWLEVERRGADAPLRRRASRIRCARWKLSADGPAARASRWFDYSRARDDMLAATDTKHAPWFVATPTTRRRARLNIITPPAQAGPPQGTEARKDQAAEARQERGDYRRVERIPSRSIARDQLMSEVATVGEVRLAEPDRCLPASWLPSLSARGCVRDLVAGITLAAYLLPAGIARRVARRPAARGRPVRLPVLRAGVLAVLQLAPHGDHGHVGDLAAGRRVARRDRGRRPGALRGAGGVHRAAGRGARASWPGSLRARRGRQLHLRDGDGRLQGRRGAVPREHAAAEAVRHQGRRTAISGSAWATSSRTSARRNAHGARARAARRSPCCVLGKIYLPNRPVALFVVDRGHRRGERCSISARTASSCSAKCRRGCRRSALPAVSWSDLNELLPLAHGVLPARRRRDRGHRAHVRAEARLPARHQPGVPRARRARTSPPGSATASRSAAACRSRWSTRAAARARRSRA